MLFWREEETSTYNTDQDNPDSWQCGPRNLFRWMNVQSILDTDAETEVLHNKVPEIFEIVFKRLDRVAVYTSEMGWSKWCVTQDLERLGELLWTVSSPQERGPCLVRRSQFVFDLDLHELILVRLFVSPLVLCICGNWIISSWPQFVVRIHTTFEQSTLGSDSEDLSDSHRDPPVTDRGTIDKFAWHDPTTEWLGFRV